jgi:hypothetical protein
VARQPYDETKRENVTDGGEWLAERFEADRTRLQAVACRLAGSASEADDAAVLAILGPSEDRPRLLQRNS